MALEHRYDPISAEDGSADFGDSKPTQPQRRALCARLPTILQILPWLITAAALIVLAVATTKQPTEEQCTEKLSVWCKGPSSSGWNVI